MTERIFIDAGHGGTDPGAVGNGLREKDLTLKLAKKTRDYLNANYIGHIVKLSRENDVTLSLAQRVKMANDWNATYFASIHINAGGGTGFESFVNKGTIQATKNAREHVHNAIMTELGNSVRDRGKKSASFYVIKYTDMSAILTECLFIDTKADADKLKSEAWLDKIARGHAKGIAKARGLKAKPKPKPTPKPKEDDTMLEKAILIGGFPDFPVAEVLASRLKAPIYTRAAYPGGKVAKELYVVGGSTKGLQANKIIDLSGKDRFESAAAVKKFLG